MLRIVDPAKIDLAAIIIGVANAYGLLLIILMLGYGIIAVPRDLWFYSKPEGELERLYFLAPGVYEAAQDADYDLRIVVTAVENAAERARSNSHDGSQDDDLRVFALAFGLGSAFGFASGSCSGMGNGGIPQMN